MGVFVPSFGCAGFCTQSGGQGGRSGKLPDASLAGAPDRDCNPPPTQPRSFKRPALALGAASLLQLLWATGSLETGGPHAALLSAISDPCLVPRKILDPCRQMSLTSFWRVLGANHFGAALVQTSPNFYLLSFMIHPVRSAQSPCKQRARKQVRSMRPIEPMHLDLPILDF
jgi:hypothetical protein